MSIAVRNILVGLELRRYSVNENCAQESWVPRGSGFSGWGGNGKCCGMSSTSYGRERHGMKGLRREARNAHASHRKIQQLFATAQRQQLIHDSEGEKIVDVKEYEVIGLHASSSYSDEGDELETRQGGQGRDHSSDSEPGVSTLEEDLMRREEELSVGPPTDSDTASSSSGLAVGGLVVATGVVLAVVGIGGAGFVFKDELNGLIGHLNEYIEGYGAVGYLVFILAYASLEIVAIPAIPLTMTAGLLFGNVTGTVLVSIAGTIAATVAFLIARYVARDRLLLLAKDNKQFLAIDKAIGEDSFKIVTLLRLSPLLPFSLGNYLYGLTSVKLVPYVAGSWLGMLPGTWAYVCAGALSRSFLADDGSDVSVMPSNWMIALGLAATVGVAWYITRIAKDALDKVNDE
eukprot:TRINITY_DN16598_c0_g1_i1.p1 TRINITY_DN16598_c0_g1~~TRINITY_DN16598_c0_g1_i1.p1  ORF type:complete len:403 (+),score=63.02 TRINITY_DN16598_c0_g1_i1:203-1411(+)